MILVYNRKRVQDNGPATEYKLNHDPAFTEYIELNGGTAINFSGSSVWELEFNFRYDSVNSSFLCLLYSTTGGVTRILVRTTGLIFNFAGSGNYSASETISYGTEHNLIVKRDSSNDIYYNLNGGGDTFIVNNTSTAMTAREICSEGGTERYLDGYLRNFKIDSSTFELNEGSGVSLTADDLETAEFITTGDTTHVNTVSWETY